MFYAYLCFLKFFFVFIDLEKNSGKRIYFMQIYSLSYELWIKIIFFWIRYNWINVLIRNGICNCSSERDILLLTHHLYSRLADDIVIFPRPDQKGEELQKAIEAIKKEIEIMKPKETETGSRTVQMARSELPESDDSGAVLVNNVRENFRKRKEMANKCDMQFYQNSAKTNSVCLYKYQQQTDKAIAELELWR